MTCPICNTKMEEEDQHSEEYWAGDYWSPPEYTLIWILYRCPECWYREYDY